MTQWFEGEKNYVRTVIDARDKPFTTHVVSLCDGSTTKVMQYIANAIMMDKIQPSAPSKFSRWQTRQCDRHTVLKFGFEALSSGPLLSPLAACWSQWWVQKTHMRYHVHLELGTTMLGLAPPSSDIPPSMLGLLQYQLLPYPIPSPEASSSSPPTRTWYTSNTTLTKRSSDFVS
jgi:hypothetical protein